MFEYRYPVDRIIHALKYGQRLPLAAWCARQIGRRLGSRCQMRDSPHALIPMPTSKERLASRGFDHAAEIARLLSGITGLPCADRWCRRVSRGPAQAALRWRDRAANVAGVFRCRSIDPPRPVAIVDDVMTSGASAAELARTLRAAGATRVEVWLVARTLPPTDAGGRQAARRPSAEG
jgi:ComF family protein